jgi:ESF2/ABP1 family protein
MNNKRATYQMCGSQRCLHWDVEVVKGQLEENFAEMNLSGTEAARAWPNFSNTCLYRFLVFDCRTLSNMASLKRNEWLEAEDEDEELSDRSDEEQGRGRTFSRANKKRKLESNEPSGSDASEDDTDDESKRPKKRSSSLQQADEHPEAQHKPEATKPKPSAVDKKLKKLQDASSRSGVVYLSHIPPFMKPHTLKNLLLPFAPSGLGRIYLTPEDPDRRTARVRAGGNKKRNFEDGWVEFASKKEAKVVVETLNTRTIGGRKGGYYFDDVWNLKYLRGFKWRHLTEQITNENEERAARMRAEAASSKREMREFLRNVERARIDDNRRKKGQFIEQTGDPDKRRESQRPKIDFDQSKPIYAEKKKKSKEMDEELKAKVMSQIF